MADLITHLEAATGPSRELDAEIWATINGLTLRVDDRNLVMAETPEGLPRLVGFVDPGECQSNFRLEAGHEEIISHYTESVDAAMTLIPEGWSVYSASWGAEEAEFMLHDPKTGARGPWNGATPALALCIACLRAREAES